VARTICKAHQDAKRMVFSFDGGWHLALLPLALVERSTLEPPEHDRSRLLVRKPAEHSPKVWINSLVVGPRAPPFGHQRADLVPFGNGPFARNSQGTRHSVGAPVLKSSFAQMQVMDRARQHEPP